jgi:hypothetical protein
MFARLDAYGARPYSGRAMFGARCLGIVGLSQLLEAIRDVPELPISGWQHDSMGRDVIYYNPRIQIALEVVNDYYED